MKLTCVTATWNVIKAGNRESLIRCVKSVAALKTEHEHLIYDGASTDGTAELLRELEAITPGLKVVSEPDTGIYNALNKGVRDAKGEWFYVLGADDYIFAPDVMDDIVSGLNEDDDEVITNVKLEGVAKYSMRLINLECTLTLTPYCHQGVILRTSLIKKFGGFDESYRIVGDYELLLRMHMSGLRFRVSDKVFASFSAAGVSSVLKEKMNDEFHELTRRFYHLSEKEYIKYLATTLLPYRCLVPFVFHKDRAIRYSAREKLKIRIKLALRIPLYPLVVLTRPLRYRK